MLSKLLIILGVVVLVGGGTVGGYFYGKSQAKTVSNNSSGSQTEATKVALQVPEGATITAQCVAGRGTQYIMPKDIPYGPIYDVYQNKVIGLEYMVPKDTLPTTAVSKIHYALMNVPYDHIDIGAVPEGHAGFTMTHYHLDFLNITKEASDKITCADTTPTVMPSMSPTVTPTMSHM